MLFLEHPDPPTAVTTSTAMPMSFHLNWTAGFNGNRPHLFFILNVTSSDHKPSIINTSDSGISANKFYETIIGKDIVPFTDYIATVAGCNEIGCSDPSKKSNSIRTKQYSELLTNRN